MKDSPSPKLTVPSLRDCRRVGRVGTRNGNELSSRFALIRRRGGQNTARLFGFMIFLLGGLAANAQTTMSEYQVKALFLLNFVKYVDWSAVTPPNAGGPIVIGILGQDNLEDDLARAAAGKSVNGRTIIIKRVSEDEALNGCSILFIGSSENSRLDEILGKTSVLPILTVGEDESFLQKGGIIDFVLRDGKIHLQINLRAARQVKLQISSKLLGVAEVVKE
jgi:hypothetical protein